MLKDQAIGSFYKTYKVLHKEIKTNIEVDNNEYVAARILDKLIIFMFIKESIINEKESLAIDSLLKDKGSSVVIDFYKNPQKYVSSKINLVVSVINVFDISDYNDLELLSNEKLYRILIKLSKFEWSFSDNREGAITPDVLGSVFEKYINQKDMGAYYTELDTIKYINKNSMLYSILNLLKDEDICMLNCEVSIRDNIDLIELYDKLIDEISDKNKLDKVLNILDNFTVVDVTMGTGAFLLNAIDILEELYIKVYKRYLKLNFDLKYDKLTLMLKIIENNIYGIDIMEDAIEIAIFRVYLRIIKLCLDNNIDMAINVKINFKVGNTLIGKLFDNSIKYNFFSSFENEEKKFNWCEEFPEVNRVGGFDCIIGNPPYIEYAKVKKKYIVDDLVSLKCGNIYAFIIERAIKLLKNNGVLGFIVPISIVSTNRMKPIRNYIRKECSSIFISNFGDRPSCLFNGVHQKLSIIICRKNRNNETKIYTSKYFHWYKCEKDNLFTQIKYIDSTYMNDDLFYKVGNNIHSSIINKINNKKNKLSSIINKKKNSNYYVFLSCRLTFWVKSFINNKKSSEFKKIFFDNNSNKLIFNAILNSSTYYLFWETVSDCWHITNKELDLFKFDIDELSLKQKIMLEELSIKLEEDLEKNKEYIGSSQTEYEYKHKYSKNILDEIDKVLAEYYGFTKEEYYFIIDYNISYRMNDQLETYLKKRKKENSYECN